MKPTLPSYLVTSILLISQASSQHVQTTSVDSVSPSPTPLSGVGFSLRGNWADLRHEETCPVPAAIDGTSPVPSGSVSASTAPQEGIPSAAEVGALVSPPVTPAEAPQAPSAVTDDALLSFEDWKRNHEEEEDFQGTAASLVDVGAARNDSNYSILVPHKTPPSPPESNTTKETLVTSAPVKTGLPLVLHNRYNYASPDCSARIHSSSPQTQHASSLLHKSRDRYMLTPCKANEHWVVIELCDEVRIEAVEVAIWEFFSGVVRDIRVSVGGEDDEEDDLQRNNSRWAEVGSFVARNVRGVQVSAISDNPDGRLLLYPKRHPFTVSYD
jgi:hypothetical protein